MKNRKKNKIKVHLQSYFNFGPEVRPFYMLEMWVRYYKLQIGDNNYLILNISKYVLKTSNYLLTYWPKQTTYFKHILIGPDHGIAS